MSGLAYAQCGPYVLVGRGDSLQEASDGSVVLCAEQRYVVRCAEGARRDVLGEALRFAPGASEGTLQFGNFVGRAALGGRPLDVRSNRLSADAVTAMLDEVADALVALPFGAMTPTAATYERHRALTPDALYHAYVCVRDAMRPRGPHDLPGAVGRILSRPHEQLYADVPRLQPLSAVRTIDAESVMAIATAPELLSTPAPESPLAGSPLARRLGGRVPETVRTRPLEHSTDTRENRFVAAALDAASDICRRFERLAREQALPAGDANALEAAELALRLQRWRRHPALAHVASDGGVPLQSTVLRGRAGYRQLLGFHLDLLARSRLSQRHDLRTLLELRDAATIYEAWCYFRVLAGARAVLGPPVAVDRFAVDDLGARVPWGYRAHWGDVEVVYNRSYSALQGGPAVRGQHSYSLRLRPDITLRDAFGALHLLDAKLKQRDESFKPEDLHKMHAYRDALGATSVWMLYPGGHAAPSRYVAPWHAPEAAFSGVGALALHPGAGHDGGLAALITELLVL